jgi:MFS superfamily sulfate permease-like transporter
MALTVMVTLLFLMPLFVYTPNVVLGAIIIAAVIGLIDAPAVYQIWKMDKMDFLVCVCAFAGVIFISVQEGLAIAVKSSLLLAFGNRFDHESGRIGFGRVVSDCRVKIPARAPPVTRLGRVQVF